MNHTRLLRGAGLIAILAVMVTLMAWPDLQNTARADNTEFQSPGDFPGAAVWTNPERAFTDDGTVATETQNQDQQSYIDFDFAVPAGSFVLGIVVQLNAWSADADGCQLAVELDGGSGPSDPRTADLDDDVDANHALGGSTDLWGATWTADQFTNENFVARVKYVDTSSCDDGSQANLDHIQVNVFYKSLTDTGLQPPKDTDVPSNWLDPGEAFVSDETYATSDDHNDAQRYVDFNLNVPDPAIITGVEVLVEHAFSNDEDGCQLVVKISGDIALGFGTSTKTIDLNDNAEADYTLGGSDDLWDTPPAPWNAGHFSDANFVLELVNFDPDPGDNTLCTDVDEDPVVSVDYVAVRVHYKPLEQTGKSSPSATHEPNNWVDATNAFTNNDIDATATTDDQRQGYSGFDLDVPLDSIIVGIEVQVKASSADDGGDCQLDVALSWDGGASGSYTPNKTIELTGSQTPIHVLGGIDDVWDTRPWSVDELSNDNFVVRVINVDATDCDPPTTGLDHIQVNVFYKDINDAGFQPPSETHVPNDFATPENAFVKDATDATEDANGEQQGYAGFGLNVPDGSIVTGIEVLVQASSQDTNGGCELDVTLSWDSAVNETAAKKILLTGSQTPAHRLGGSNDTWGRDWIGSNFDDGNFVLILTNIHNTGCDVARDLLLDYVELNVYWKPHVPPATNTPTETDTPTITNTPEDTNTPTITATPTATATGTATATPTITATPTVTDTPTSTNTPTSTPTPTKPLGDVNDDGFINSIDSLFILQFDARLITSLINPESADVNEDGTINALDASLILQFDAGFITQLPP